MTLLNTSPAVALASSSILSELMKDPTPLPSALAMVTALNRMLNGF